MATESGKDGKVLIGSDSVGDVTKWDFTKAANTSRYASSSTGGFKKTIPGVKEGAGSIEFKLDASAASPLNEGSVATLLLYVDATHFYTVPAVIKSFKLETNIDTGDVIGCTADFETDGVWTEPTWS